MAKPEWGIKRTCSTCGARFYDLKRVPVICPKCESEIDIDALSRPRRQERKKTVPKVIAPIALDGEAVIVVDDDDIESDSDDDMDDFLEDASDLGEDESDLDEVKEHIGFEEHE